MDAKLDANTVGTSDGSTTKEIRYSSSRAQSDDWPISRSSASRASASDQTVRLAKRTCASALLLALLRIGRQQIVERRRPLRMLDMGDRLGLAAAEHVAIELRAAEQLLGHVADGFEALEPQRERGRHVLRALAFGRVRIGQQQPRFEIGEPRRHHQIVGRQLEPQLARLLDEGEILVGQRQDRDLGEVDLLLAREREQEIERTLEAFDVDDQSRLVGRPLGRRGSASNLISSRLMRSPSAPLPEHP